MVGGRMTGRISLTALLIVLGAGWGLTQPLGKIAVDAGYLPFGLIFWQLLIGAVLTTAVLLVRRKPLPVHPRSVLFFAVIALLGTLVPNTASYRAAFFLPAGIMSIVIATIPMLAFPIALALGTDWFSWRRMAGLSLGLVGVGCIAIPEASLPDRAMIAVLPLALIAPLCYAMEGNVVAKWGTGGLDPVQLLCGASILGAIVALPLAVGTGQFIDPRPPYGVADFAFALSSVIHVIVYMTFVWLVGRAGAVFAGQVSYLVTGFGVIWAMVLLDERYSVWIWAALVVMLCGIALVRPRQDDDSLM
jgi:drug/metabolite transporter (DMT)-like permease